MHKVSVLFALALLAVGSSSVSAQSHSPFSFGLNAGVAVPVSDSRNDLGTGFTIGATADLATPSLSPLSFRGDLNFTRHGIKGFDGNFRDVGAGLNALLWLPVEAAAKPYLIGGINLVRVTASSPIPGGSVSVSETEGGFNVGAGMDFAVGMKALRLEARYKRISMDGPDYASIPVTLAFRF